MVSGAGSADGKGESALAGAERSGSGSGACLSSFLQVLSCGHDVAVEGFGVAPWASFSVSESQLVPASRARISIFFFTFRNMLQLLWYFLPF